MHIYYLTSNIINIAIISYITRLAIRGHIVDALMATLLGLLCAPYCTIQGITIPFAYLASVSLLVYVCFCGHHLKVPQNHFTLFMSIIIYSLFFTRIISTVICVFAYTPRNVLWVTLLGRLRGIIIYSISMVLAYNGLDNQPHNVRSKLTSKILSVMVISMTLNLIAVGIQFIYPEWGFQLVNNWYSSESKYTIGSMKQVGSFLRLYGLNYSSVIMGINSLLAFAGALFYMVRPRNKVENSKAIAVIILSFINGVLSMTKTFVLGSVICIVINLLYRVLQKLRYSRKTGMNMVNSLMLACLLMATIVMVINTDQLDRVTGLPFSYYIGRTIRSPLGAFDTRYKYEMIPLDYQSIYDVIQSNPLLGVGLTSRPGEFIGDSEYLVAMHDGGIVALITTLMEIGLVIYVSLSKHLYMFVGLWLATAMAGFATAALSTDLCLCLVGIFTGYIAYLELTMHSYN